MLDGKYNASLNTPIGAINGVITLNTNGNEVIGVLETMGMKNNFRGNKINEQQCKFSGNFSTPLGNINYMATCTVNNNVLELMANTNKGSFKIMGKRM